MSFKKISKEEMQAIAPAIYDVLKDGDRLSIGQIVALTGLSQHEVVDTLQYWLTPRAYVDSNRQGWNGRERRVSEATKYWLTKQAIAHGKYDDAVNLNPAFIGVKIYKVGEAAG